ncbi:MAG TPA: hypothetical protein VF199_01940 [Bacillales bacterium]
MNKMLTGISIAIVLSFGYFGYNVTFETGANKQLQMSDPNLIIAHASWGNEFKSVESLIAASDLVVLGSLEQELSSYQPFKGKGLKDTFTDARFKIDKVFKGEKGTQSIIVSQYGGKRPNGKIEIFAELPLMEKDQQYLLFLEQIHDNTKRNGKYQTIRGVQGFYMYNPNSTFLLSNHKALKGTVNGKINKKVIEKGIKGIKEIVLR